MVQRGVLGNTEYIDSEDGWAVDVGEIFGKLRLAAITFELGSDIWPLRQITAHAEISVQEPSRSPIAK